MAFRLSEEDIANIDILTALRGPDYTDADAEAALLVKYVTTSVLRHLVGSKYGYSFSLAQAQAMWDNRSTNQQEAAKAFYKAHQHFRSHIGAALGYLSNQGLTEAEEATLWITTHLGNSYG